MKKRRHPNGCLLFLLCFCKRNYLLLNWGARRAALRPYWWECGAQKLLICKGFRILPEKLSRRLSHIFWKDPFDIWFKVSLKKEATVQKLQPCKEVFQQNETRRKRFFLLRQVFLLSDKLILISKSVPLSAQDWANETDYSRTTLKSCTSFMCLILSCGLLPISAPHIGQYGTCL